MGYLYHRTIHLADTDAAGVVYFAHLLNICHEAYETCLQEAGMNWQNLIQAKNTALPIVHAEIDFLAPIQWGDRLEIRLRPEKLRDSEYKVNYHLTKISPNHHDKQLVAKAMTRHVSIVPSEQKRSPIPSQIQEWLKNATVNHE